MATAWTPERTAKFRATMAAKKKERTDDEAQDPHTAALQKFAAKKRKRKPKVTHIPLASIPDERKRSHKAKRRAGHAASKPNGATKITAREEVLLAALKVLLDLAGERR